MTPEKLGYFIEAIYQGIKGCVSMLTPFGNRKTHRSKIKEGVKAAACEGIMFGGSLGPLQKSIVES